MSSATGFCNVESAILELSFGCVASYTCSLLIRHANLQQLGNPVRLVLFAFKSCSPAGLMAVDESGHCQVVQLLLVNEKSDWKIASQGDMLSLLCTKSKQQQQQRQLMTVLTTC